MDQVSCETSCASGQVTGVPLRLIGKWLNAGVMEDGVTEYPVAGTEEDGAITP